MHGSGPELGYFLIVAGLASFTLAVTYAIRPRMWRRLPATTDVDVTISVDGLHLRPSGRRLPWKAIFSVRDVGEYVAFVSRNGVSRAAVAKRDLPHDGRDLWLALDDLLVSKRYLIRTATSTRWLIVDPSATARARDESLVVTARG